MPFLRAGVHGAERRYADGGFERLSTDADALVRLERELRAELTQLSTQFSGVVLESKALRLPCITATHLKPRTPC
ncbi:hypothetical protein ACU4HD_44130 [Cupriavidus basilensis]